MEPQAFKRKTRTDFGRDKTDADQRSTFRQSFWGEKQRAYLAQALCADPKLLILDEATASLDTTNKHELLQMLREVMQQHGLTILFITHDPELIEQYADYELHLEDQTGVLLEKGAKK